MRFKRSIGTFLASVMALCASPALALDFSRDGIYRATKAACSQVSRKDLDTLRRDEMQAGLFRNLEFNQLLGFIRQESRSAALNMDFSIGKTTKYLATNDGFLWALRTCYPNDRSMQEFFVESVYGADRAGKGKAILTIATLQTAIGQAARIMTGWSRVASTVLNKIDKTFWIAYATSFLTSDTQQTVKPVVLDGPKLYQMHMEANKNLEAMAESVKQQLQAEVDKIKACGDCPAREKLQANKDGLESVFHALSNEN